MGKIKEDINLFKGDVSMPDTSQRRFQLKSDLSGKRWWVVDTLNNDEIVYGKAIKGKKQKGRGFTNAQVACHYLNKNYYKEVNMENKPVNENKNISEDLQPVEDTPPTPELPIDDLDLEEVAGEEGAEGEGGKDYQYTLTVKQGDEEGEENLEPSFTFILTPKEEEGEEMEDELESIEDTSAGIEGAQAPQPSVAPEAAPLPESVLTDLEPITEQEGVMGPAGGENTPPPPAPPDAAPLPEEQPLPEEEPELDEVAPVELSEEDLKSFIEGSEIEIKFSIDEETEFTLDEAVDYLKLYPDTEVFVAIQGDLEEFKTKLDEFTAGQEEATDEAATEDQNVMVNDQGETLDMTNTPQANPATPQVQQESFSIFNMKGKKNLPDGIYIGHLTENKLYGRIDLKLTSNKLIIDKDVFELDNQVNIKEAKEKEAIELMLKEADVKKLVGILEAKADITVKL
jgi:hypothetical protein